MEQLVPWLHNPCHIKVPTHRLMMLSSKTDGNDGK